MKVTQYKTDRTKTKEMPPIESEVSPTTKELPSTMPGLSRKYLQGTKISPQDGQFRDRTDRTETKQNASNKFRGFADS